MRSVKTTAATVVAAIIGAACCAGCQASREGVEVIDMNYLRIDDKEKLIRHVDVGHGYWWTEKGRLYIALTTDTRGLTQLDHKRFDLTLVLDGLPADRSRTYQFGREAVRGYLHYGMSHERFRSMRGIANLRLESGNRLSGRFRMSAAKEFFHVLTDWAPAGPVVLLGKFRAVKNQRAGGPVLARSEEDGMGRTQLTTRQPAGAEPRRPAPARTGPMPVTRPKPVKVVGPELMMKPAS